MLWFQVRAGGRRVQVQPVSERRLLPQPHQQVYLRVRHELRRRRVPDGRKRHLLLRGFALVAEPLPAALLPDPQAGRRAGGGLGRKRLSLCAHVRQAAFKLIDRAIIQNTPQNDLCLKMILNKRHLIKYSYVPAYMHIIKRTCCSR